MPGESARDFQHACLLDQAGRDAEARQAYLDVLASDMGHLGALRGLAALLIRGGFTSAGRTVLEQAIAAHPGDPAAHVELGHLLREAGERRTARQHYEIALGIDPGQPEAHQGLSYLFDGLDETAAARHRLLGFADRVLTTQAFRGAGSPVRVLRLVSARGGNVPTGRFLDDRVFLTHTLVAEFARAGQALPPHDVVFNAIGDADRCDGALRAAEALPLGTGVAVINAPARVLATTRAGNSLRLGRLDGIVAARLLAAPRAGLSAGAPEGFGFPFLLRSPGFHTGEHFLRVDSQVELVRACDQLPGEVLHVIEPLDARGADGFVRKYRVMLVAGEMLPLHLAISRDWKVHHFTAGMEDVPEHRAEEAAFLSNMHGVLGARAIDALRRVADELGLDYGGIDFALAPDGGVLLFEANATMAVVPPPPGAMWDYRRPAANAVINAARLMVLEAKARGAAPSI